VTAQAAATLHLMTRGRAILVLATILPFNNVVRGLKRL
jgi:alkanesulfonate monooxygenase SsuD/methylene tetrahydromethanopterin reductase-like flavin-dependent oxidoreductase (luciferase family)